jgi:polyisoprenoid-binding protein YceI
MNKITLAAALLVCPVLSVLADDYVIDGSGAGMHSSIGFKASHIGISSLWGRFNNITGHFIYDADDIEASKIMVNIDPASIDSNHQARDEHLRTSDFLDVESHPIASFESSSVEDLGEGRIRVNGTFSLHGMTRDISFDAVRTGEGETPFGDYRVGFEGELVLDTSDYGINAGPVELVLAIEGVRQ